MAIMRRCCWSIVGAVLFLFASTGGQAWAAEVTLAVTRATDPFVKELQSSKYLAQSGIKIKLVTVAKDEDVLDGVVKGAADLGLFPIGVLSNRKFEEQPQLYSVFTRSFLFNSATEILEVERTPVGAAVLADVSRIGIFPLSFWNRGLSQIWAKQPLYTAEQFHGLTIAESTARRPDDHQYEERNVLLASLGAKQTKVPTSRIAEDMAKGIAGATIWEPTDNNNLDPDTGHFGFRVYATEFQPKVGIFASSLKYWNSLSEQEKTVWKQVTEEVGGYSESQMRAIDASLRRNTTPVSSPERQQSLRNLASTVATFSAGTPRLKEDLQLIDEAKTYLMLNPEFGKKKPN
jgi:TRAP-type C4-dicarboxylate transport system substrate-binding protein